MFFRNVFTFFGHIEPFRSQVYPCECQDVVDIRNLFRKMCCMHHIEIVCRTHWIKWWYFDLFSAHASWNDVVINWTYLNITYCKYCMYIFFLREWARVPLFVVLSQKNDCRICMDLTLLSVLTEMSDFCTLYVLYMNCLVIWLVGCLFFQSELNSLHSSGRIAFDWPHRVCTLMRPIHLRPKHGSYLFNIFYLIGNSFLDME